MKLYYVTHTVTTELSHAVIARDEQHLLEILSDREQQFRQQKFVTKFEKDKNKIVGHELNPDWHDYSKLLPNRGKAFYDAHIKDLETEYKLVPSWNELSQEEREYWNSQEATHKK